MAINPDDLDTLSLLTGIRVVDLKEMRTGSRSPSDPHLHRLRVVLDDEDAVGLFLTHERRDPQFSTSRPGHVPKGTELLPYVPAETVQVGDYLAYRPTKRVPGAQWVQVESVNVDDTIVTITTSGEEAVTTITMKRERPLRVARPVSS